MTSRRILVEPEGFNANELTSRNDAERMVAERMVLVGSPHVASETRPHPGMWSPPSRHATPSQVRQRRGLHRRGRSVPQETWRHGTERLQGFSRAPENA